MALRRTLSPQVKTLLLSAAQNTMELPLAPPSPAGEVATGVSGPQHLLSEVISFRTLARAPFL